MRGDNFAVLNSPSFREIAEASAADAPPKCP
jgi:hypothetical protein